jgi:hypothetical protein
VRQDISQGGRPRVSIGSADQTSDGNSATASAFNAKGAKDAKVTKGFIALRASCGAPEPAEGRKSILAIFAPFGSFALNPINEATQAMPIASRCGQW